MPDDWMTDDERLKADAREKWTRVEAWAFGFGLAALTLIGLAHMLGWR